MHDLNVKCSRVAAGLALGAVFATMSIFALFHHCGVDVLETLTSVSIRETSQQHFAASNSILCLACFVIAVLVSYALGVYYAAGFIFQRVFPKDGSPKPAGLLELPDAGSVGRELEKSQDSAEAQSECDSQSVHFSHSNLERSGDVPERDRTFQSRFIAKVSHELRTPIHSIVGMLRILSKDEQCPQRRLYMGMASDAAYALLETINQILDFSASEGDHFSLDSAPFTIRDCITDVLRAITPAIAKKGSLELLYEMDPQVGAEYEGDRVRLKQALVNLLENAIKFTEQGHVSLHVTCETSEKSDMDRLIFRVVDTGVGISAQNLKSIFDPFVQEDDSVTRAHAGTGLGLTIVRQIAEAMGGTIDAESAPSQGSTFILSVYMQCTGRGCVLDVGPLKDKRVTIVDTPSSWRSFVAHGLRHLGVSAAFADIASVRHVDSLVSSGVATGILVVTGRALHLSKVFDALIHAACESETPHSAPSILVVLDPTETALREKMHALGIHAICSPAPSAEGVLREIVQAFDGDSGKIAEPKGSSAQIGISNRPLEVLIADDARTNRIILRAMLEDAGHQVTAVENGLDLLKHLEPAFQRLAGAAEFDLVLTDMQMPVMDGLTATRKIRDLEKQLGVTERLPVIAVTAHARQEETEEMLQAGLDAVLSKPIEPEQLTAVIQQFCGAAIDEHKVGNQVIGQSVKDLAIEQLSMIVWNQWMEMGAEALPVDLGDEWQSYTPAEMLDIDDVYERTGDSVLRAVLVLQAFTGCYRELLTNLVAAKFDTDPSAVRFAAHALKGLLLDIGAKIPAKVAAQLEACAKFNQSVDVPQLTTRLGVHVLWTARLVERVLGHLQIDGLHPDMQGA
jgi:signal transduction histidine kinase/CheY-like chemotaxis protein